MSDDNMYVQLVRDDTVSALRGSMQTAVDTQPDVEAKLQGLAKQYNLPVEAVRLDRATVERRAKIDSLDYKTLAEQYPSTSKFLTDPNNLAIAQDDVDNLSAIESTMGPIRGPKANTWSVAKGLAKSLPQGAELARQGIRMQFADLYDYIGLFSPESNDKMRQDALRKSSQANLEREVATPEFQGDTARGVYGGASSFVRMVPGLAASLATRNAGPLLMTAGIQTEAEAYGKYRARGATAGEALAGATGEGAVEVATEMLPMGFLVKNMGKMGAGSFLTGLLAREVPGEQIATLVQDAIDTAVANPDKTWKEYLDERPGAAYQTLIATLTQSVISGGLNSVAGRVSGRVHEAEQGIQIGESLQEMNKLVEASKVRERDVTTVQNFFQSLVEEGRDSVWITPQALVDSGLAEQIAQVIPAVAEQLQGALESGAEIRIPIADLMVQMAGPEIASSVLPHLANEPGGFTATTAAEYMQSGAAQELHDEVTRAVTAKAEDIDFKLSRDAVSAQVLDQLNTAGRFTPDVNSAYASMVGNFYAVQAAKVGITPEEMAQRYPLQVRAERLAGAKTLDQPDAESGPFGPIATQFKGDSSGAIEHLTAQQDGEAVGALHHPEIGDIDLVWGVAGDPARSYAGGYGLAKIVAKHPEVLDDLQNIVSSMTVVSRSENRAQLESDDHKGAVRLQWDGQAKKWLMTAFEKDEKSGAEPRTDTSDVKKDDSPSATSLNPDASVDQKLDQFYQNKQSPRGSITLGDDITNTPSVITLLAKADLSTFLHESGHFFLEVMNDMAGRADAPASVTEDMAAVLKWFGVDNLATWNGYDIEQKRGYHEQFARGFEAYLFEGNAPNAELLGLFSRFRAWMLNVYKSLKSLNVELSDEVRGVFDRMVASTEAINEAEIDANLGGLFATKPDFMADDEWLAYQSLGTDATNEAIHSLEARSLRDMKWLTNAKGKLLAKMQREASEKRAAVRAEVVAEVMAEPINRVQTFLKRGMVDGQAVEGGFKLSIAEIDEIYKDNPAIKSIKDALGYGKYGMLGTENGIHPDQVAEDFGFQSADEMVRGIINAANPNEKIEGITDQRMLERYGDLTDEQAIGRAVDAALHDEARIRFVATELNALNKAIGSRPVLAKAAKSYAEASIARLKVRDLRPHLYTAAAKRAAKASETAFGKGDLRTAAVEKQNQLINTYAARAATEAREEIAKTMARFLKIANGKDDVVGKTRDMDMVHATRAILAEYGIGSKGKKALEYLKAVEANDPGMYAVLRDRVDAAVENAVGPKDITIEQVRALRDEVESLWFLAKRSRQMEVDGDLLDREEVQDELRARLDEIGVPLVAPGEGRAITEDEVKLSMMQSWRAAARRVESWVGAKDGGASMGPFRKYVWNSIKDQADAYRTDKGVYLKKYRELLDPIAATLKPVKIAAPELGYTFGFDKGGAGKVELLHALLHTGNDGNKKKLLLGRKWATENADGTIDTSQWDAFVNRMIDEGRLTKADFDFAQGVWDLMESMKPLAQKAHRDVFGRYFDEVTATPFVTPFGTYAGGYVPAIADSRIVSDAKTRALAEEENSTMQLAFPATSKGFTKGRVDYNKPLLLDLRSLSQHIDKVLLFSHLEQPIRDVRRVLSSKSVAYALNRIDPSAFDGLLTPWLNRTARQQVETAVAGSNGLMRFFSVVRQRAGMAAMFANVSNTAQQVTGLSLALLKVKPKYLMPAVVDFLRSPRQMADAVAAASPYMAMRMENEVQSMNEAINEILLNPTLYQNALAWTAKHTYFMQSAVDNVLSPMIWHGAYNQAIETAPSDLADEQLQTYARRLADSAVRETQGSTLPEDVSRIETGTAFVRMFTQFAGYFNMQANVIGTELAKVSQDVGLRKGAGKGLYVLMFGFFIPAWVATGIALAFRGGPDDEDKDGSYLDDWLAQTLGWGTLRSATAMVPVLGQTINSMANTFNGKPYDDKISTSPAISMIESAVSAPASVYKAIAEDSKPSKAIRDTATLVSMTVGLPANAAAKPINYLSTVLNGDVLPTSPADAVRGGITGVSSPQSKR